MLRFYHRCDDLSITCYIARFRSRFKALITLQQSRKVTNKTKLTDNGTRAAGVSHSNHPEIYMPI